MDEKWKTAIKKTQKSQTTVPKIPHCTTMKKRKPKHKYSSILCAGTIKLDDNDFSVTKAGGTQDTEICICIRQKSGAIHLDVLNAYDLFEKLLTNVPMCFILVHWKYCLNPRSPSSRTTQTATS